MNRLLFSVLWACLIFASCSDESDVRALIKPFEKSDSAQTATYEETIGWWRVLEQESPYVCMKEFGETDAGLPLHVVLINSAGINL